MRKDNLGNIYQRHALKLAYVYYSPHSWGNRNRQAGAIKHKTSMVLLLRIFFLENQLSPTGNLNPCIAHHHQHAGG